MNKIQDENEEDETEIWHLGDKMQHSYFLDTVENIRTTG
jgi:hypothetical protein